MHMNLPNISVNDICTRQIVSQKRGLPYTHTALIFIFLGTFVDKPIHTIPSSLPKPYPNPTHPLATRRFYSKGPI